MAIIRIKPGAGFDQQLRDGVSTSMFKMLDGKFALNAQKIFEKIGDYIVDIFEKTDVVKSLRGNGSVDLPAHFGLSDEQAEGLVNGMSNIIMNSIVLQSHVRPNGGSLIIKVIKTDWENYLSLPGAQYISQPSNATIPVLEWMLINPNIDIGQAAYSIVFEGEPRFNAKVSRSGRAIMASLNSLGGGGTGYVLPDIIRKSGSSNFIEFAICQPQVAENIGLLVMTKLAL